MSGKVAGEASGGVHSNPSSHTATHVPHAPRACAAGRDNVIPISLQYGCYHHRKILNHLTSLSNPQPLISIALSRSCTFAIVQVLNECFFVCNAPPSYKTLCRRTLWSACDPSLRHHSSVLKDCEGGHCRLRLSLSSILTPETQCKIRDADQSDLQADPLSSET